MLVIGFCMDYKVLLEVVLSDNKSKLLFNLVDSCSKSWNFYKLLVYAQPFHTYGNLCNESDINYEDTIYCMKNKIWHFKTYLHRTE